MGSIHVLYVLSAGDTVDLYRDGSDVSTDKESDTHVEYCSKLTMKRYGFRTPRPFLDVEFIWCISACILVSIGQLVFI